MATKISEELYTWFPSKDERFSCKGCAVCKGTACIGQLPGMGGVDQSKNFLLNCNAWSNFYENLSVADKNKIDSIKINPQNIGIAPVTGATQNIGFKNEKDFYLPYFGAAFEAGIMICAGDGAPDDKLKFGYEAISELGTKGWFFLKPYPDEVLKARINLVKDNAIGIGIDIDAYNIVTMRNQVSLEKKSQNQLEWFKKESGLPLVLKGIFTEEDIQLCETVRPDVVVVSNHGGRVQTAEGNTLDFLKKHAARLKKCSSEIWIDGGLRTKKDIQTALFLGADKVLIARGFISKLISTGVKGMLDYAFSLFN